MLLTAQARRLKEAPVWTAADEELAQQGESAASAPSTTATGSAVTFPSATIKGAVSAPSESKRRSSRAAAKEKERETEREREP